MRVHGGRIASLLPYALASAAVVVASAIALAGSLRSPEGPSGPAFPAAPPTPGARVAALSDARMAYWRPAASGSLERWVGDLDGKRSWTIATANADADLGLTRWSPDGSAVAYRTGNGTIGIVRLDGSLAALVMPLELRRAAWKIVNYEWSPDAKRIAATFRAGNGLSRESDVYVADTRPNAPWQRVTTMGDAYAAQWIDGDRFFVETSSGMIAVLDPGTKTARPVTGIPATSPLIGRDGRLYFVGGRSVTADVASQPVAAGWVWSATIDGGDVRRETAAEQSQARLFGLLADGRVVTGVPGGVYFSSSSETLVPLAFVGAGTVRRVVVGDDGRRVLGITESRILQIDPAKIPYTLASNALPPASAAVTLLSAVRDADVWTAPKPVTLARVTPFASGGPRARLAFTLGRAAWQAEPDGAVRMLIEDPDRPVAFPRWSPSGDRVAVSLAGNARAQGGVAVVGPSGTARWEVPIGSSPVVEWSPDGSQIAVQMPAGVRLDQWTTQLYDAATARPGERTGGRATWVGDARIVLSDGEPGATFVRVDQRVELIDGGSRRTVTDARRLAEASVLRDLPNASLPLLISQLIPLRDGQHVALWVSRLRQAGIVSMALVAVRVADGEVLWAFPAQPRQANAEAVVPSPAGHLLGWTIVNEGETPSSNAVVLDPLANATYLMGAGRFAGWAPDGKWVYVARDEGLFAHRLEGGGDPVRINAFGVPVVAARP